MASALRPDDDIYEREPSPPLKAPPGGARHAQLVQTREIAIAKGNYPPHRIEKFAILQQVANKYRRKNQYE